MKTIKTFIILAVLALPIIIPGLAFADSIPFDQQSYRSSKDYYESHQELNAELKSILKEIESNKTLTTKDRDKYISSLNKNLEKQIKLELSTKELHQAVKKFDAIDTKGWKDAMKLYNKKDENTDPENPFYFNPPQKVDYSEAYDYLDKTLKGIKIDKKTIKKELKILGNKEVSLEQIEKDIIAGKNFDFTVLTSMLSFAFVLGLSLLLILKKKVS